MGKVVKQYDRRTVVFKLSVLDIDTENMDLDLKEDFSYNLKVSSSEDRDDVLFEKEDIEFDVRPKNNEVRVQFNEDDLREHGVFIAELRVTINDPETEEVDWVERSRDLPLVILPSVHKES